MCEICRQNPCAAGCPNNDEKPLLYCSICNIGIYAEDTYYEIAGMVYCEDCTYDCRRTADRDCNYQSGAPVISYGDKWED